MAHCKGRGKIKASDRLFLYKKTNFKCSFCGLEFKYKKGYDGSEALHNGEMFLEIDHIIPIFKGGSDKLENKQALCQKCNNRKGVK